MARVSAHRLHFLTGLRGLAALFILLSHVWYQIWPAVSAPYGYWLEPDGLAAWLTGWLYYGHFGVVVFVVLSGFCLMRPVLENGGVLHGGTRGFFIRRARRILPPYYLALAFSLLLILLCIGKKTGTQWDISIPVTTSGLVSHLLLLQDLMDTTQINYVFWSIALEVHLYLAFPLFVWAWRRFGAMGTMLSFCCGIYGVMALLEWFDCCAIPPQFIGLCVYFMCGMGCAAMLNCREKKWADLCRWMPWGVLTLLVGLIVVMLCSLWGHEVAEQRFALLDALCALVTVTCLLGAACDGDANAIRALLENRVLIKIGLFSYSLYLIHAPLLQLIWQYTIQPWGMSFAQQFIALLILAVPVNLIGAYVFFLVCERPFLIPILSHNDNEMDGVFRLATG